MSRAGTPSRNTVAVALFLAICGLPLPASAADVDPPWIAGEEPGRRPAAAPRITEFNATDALAQQRLRGISQPYPGNTAAIARQGAWWSPMFQPGMPGYYDLRNLHGTPQIPLPPIAR